jgi:hypothetical protein
MIWALTTLEWKELAAAGGIVLGSGAAYWIYERKT